MKNKVVTMMYPDGTIHNVSFVSYTPIMISGICCYIAEYYDYSLNSNMITLLTNVNDVWYKVPLNQEGYEYLNDYVAQNVKERLNADDYRSLGNIALAQTMELVPPKVRTQANLLNPPKDDDLFEHKEKKPVFRCTYYVPINVNGVSNVRNTVYRSDGCVVPIVGDATYNYRKDFNCDITDRLLTMGMDRYFINNHGVKEYDFEVEIPKNTPAFKDIVLPDGREVRVEALMIPGKFECRAFYSNFEKERDYRNARLSQRISIDANQREYRDLHDCDTVWKDGGSKKLDMNFDVEERNLLRR